MRAGDRDLSADSGLESRSGDRFVKCRREPVGAGGDLSEFLEPRLDERAGLRLGDGLNLRDETD